MISWYDSARDLVICGFDHMAVDLGTSPGHWPFKRVVLHCLVYTCMYLSASSAAVPYIHQVAVFLASNSTGLTVVIQLSKWCAI